MKARCQCMKYCSLSPTLFLIKRAKDEWFLSASSALNGFSSLFLKLFLSCWLSLLVMDFWSPHASSPTDPFIYFFSFNIRRSMILVSLINKFRCSTDFGALKMWKGRSGLSHSYEGQETERFTKVNKKGAFQLTFYPEFCRKQRNGFFGHLYICIKLNRRSFSPQWLSFLRRLTVNQLSISCV